MEETILFKKQRELGSILTDTFKFIRNTWKVLFGLIFRIVGPALIVLVLSYVFYMQTAFGALSSNPFSPIDTNLESFGISVVIALLLILISVVAYYALLYGTIMGAIKSYIKNDGAIDKKEVVDEVKNSFWSLTGLSILAGIIIITGTVFCILPGIYLGTVLSTCYAVLIFEKRSVSDTISYCFNLIKGQFWMTFATLLVIGLLYYFILTIFQIPLIFYTFFKTFTIAETAGDPTEIFDWGYIALNAFSQICQYVLYAIMVITTGFIYFNLNERKNFTGTMETIDSLGKREEGEE